MIGPNELTIFDPQAIPALHGVGAKTRKGDWYDAVMPEQAIVATRSKASHDQRRRIWDKGFTPKALATYEPHVVKVVHRLNKKVMQSANEVVDCTRLFRCFGFEVASQLALAQPLNMFEEDDNHFAIEIIRVGFSVFGFLSPTPWMFRLAFSIPALANWWNRVMQWSEDQAQERGKADCAEPDVSPYPALVIQ